VISLRARFGFERAPYDRRSRLVVVQAGGRSVGLVVDEAREFVAIPAGAIQPPQESLAGLSGRYLEGIASIGDRLVLILNLEHLLSSTTSVLTAEPPAAEAASV
jgi:purine-binding chemotaxis protein CheW